MRDFHKEQGNCWRDSLRKQIKVLKISEKLGNGSDIKSMVDETSKNAIYVLNSVFKHCTRKLLRNINVKIMWTTSALDKIGSRDTAMSRNVLKNLELPSQPLDQKLKDFDKEKQNIDEKYDSKRMQKQDSTLYSEGIAQNCNPVNPEPQKSSRLFAIYAARSYNWKHQLCRRSSPDILRQRSEVKNTRIKAPKEIYRQPKIHWTVAISKSQCESTCLCWRQCCHTNIIGQQNDGTSYQSPTTSREWPRAVSTKRAYNAEISFKFCCSSEYHHKRESLKLQWQCTILLFRRLLYQ